jgi:hypothetical protein
MQRLEEWLRFGLPRLHWLMYGLFYPAILGTVIVFVLQHIANPPVGHPVSSAQLSVALTAGAFFSLSFGSALKQEDHYGIAAFVLDAVELALIIWCFFFLRLVDPIPENARQRSVPVAGVRHARRYRSSSSSCGDGPSHSKSTRLSI